MALVKRRSARVSSSYFAKEMLSKFRFFLTYNVSLSGKKLTYHVCKDFPSFSGRGNG